MSEEFARSLSEILDARGRASGKIHTEGFLAQWADLRSRVVDEPFREAAAVIDAKWDGGSMVNWRWSDGICFTVGSNTLTFVPQPEVDSVLIAGSVLPEAHVRL